MRSTERNLDQPEPTVLDDGMGGWIVNGLHYARPWHRLQTAHFLPEPGAATSCEVEYRSVPVKLYATVEPALVTCRQCLAVLAAEAEEDELRELPEAPPCPRCGAARLSTWNHEANPPWASGLEATCSSCNTWATWDDDTDGWQEVTR